MKGSKIVTEINFNHAAKPRKSAQSKIQLWYLQNVQSNSQNPLSFKCFWKISDVFKWILLEKFRLALEAVHTFNELVFTLRMHHHERLLAGEEAANNCVFGKGVACCPLPNLLKLSAQLSSLFQIITNRIDKIKITANLDLKAMPS